MSLEHKNGGEWHAVVEDVFAKFDALYITDLSCNKYIIPGQRYNLR